MNIYLYIKLLFPMQIIVEIINSHGSGKFYDSLWKARNKLVLLPQLQHWNLLCRVKYVLL